ncbi:hypothetical protein BC829DRAFT_389877 [Chytridium lagenaria]|nr:hypothetical protein BC829DRAFT_389877 [Chytridium lagenaria]
MKTNLLQLENFCTPAMMLNSHPSLIHISSVPDYLFPFLNAETAYKIYHIDKPYMRIPEPRQPKHYAPEPPVGPLWLRKDMIMMQIQDMRHLPLLILGGPFWSIAEYIMDNVVGFHLETESVFKHGLATMSEARIRLISIASLALPTEASLKRLPRRHCKSAALHLALPEHYKYGCFPISLFYPWHQKRQLFDLLLDAGADPSLGLKDAACKVEVLEYLFRKNCLQYLNEESVRLLLKIALSWPERVNLTIIDLLLSHNVGRIDSFILGKSMRTRQAVVVKKLLDYGAEVDVNIEAMIEVEAFKVFVEEMGSHGLRDLILDNCRRYPIQARHPALYTYLMEELLPKTS